MYLHPSQLRVANKRRVFRVMLTPAWGESGGGSRAELARVTGLSPVTTGKVVDELIGMGLAEELEAQRVTEGSGGAVMGRPPRIVRLNGGVRIPAVEIGVRATGVMMLSLGGGEPERRVSFRNARTVGAFVKEVSGARRQLGVGAVRAVLASVPGVLDTDAKRILFSPNLRWTEGEELLSGLEKVWGAPVCAVQEIQALALGHQAAGEPEDSFVLVDFGDGVGGAVIAGGELFHSPMPLSGEIGHTGVSGNRRRCGCGSVGCLETLVSRRGLVESFRAAHRDDGAKWVDVARRVGEKGVERWLMRSIDAAAVVIAGAINLLGIGNVVMTGDLPSLHADVAEAFQERIRDHALLGRFGRLTCRAAPRRRELGLVAAAADRVLLPEPLLTHGANAEVQSVG